MAAAVIATLESFASCVTMGVSIASEYTLVPLSALSLLGLRTITSEVKLGAASGTKASILMDNPRCTSSASVSFTRCGDRGDAGNGANASLIPPASSAVAADSAVLGGVASGVGSGKAPGRRACL